MIFGNYLDSRDRMDQNAASGIEGILYGLERERIMKFGGVLQDEAPIIKNSRIKGNQTTGNSTNAVS